MTVIDVRSKSEHKSGNVSGSLNIPLDQISNFDFNKININTDDKIELYCRSGGRANMAKMILNQRGFTNVSLLNNTGAF